MLTFEERKEIVESWLVSTDQAVATLQRWRDALKQWKADGYHESAYCVFGIAFDELYKAGVGGTWADQNIAGRLDNGRDINLDLLAEAVGAIDAEDEWKWKRNP